MAETTDGPSGVTEQVNELYWSGDRTVDEIVEELGISRTALYTSIEPVPSGVTCADCHERMVFPNRTARDRGVAVCPRCGRESAPGAESVAMGAESGVLARLGIDGADELLERAVETLRQVPPQRVALVLGGAALGVVLGALAAGAVKDR